MSVIDYEIQLQLAKQGDITAFELLVLKYERLIFSIACYMLGNYEDATDLAQEILIKVYNNLHKCADTTLLKNWLCRSTTNACIDELRKRKKCQTVLLDAEVTDYVCTTTDFMPETAILQRERVKDIIAALNKLPETQKALIILRDVHGFHYKEVAKAMDMNLGTVKSNISRARCRLRELLSD